ncbi:MAG: lysophospholipid acyltransferase family protein [Xenococcaceae cyanobacterium]
MDDPPKLREPLTSLALYHLFKWSIIAPVFHSYFRGKIYGVQKVPQSGPLIIVSNHGSYFDPPILATSVLRPVAFMAKEELFKIPLFKVAIELYGAYPVKRDSADLSAIRAAIKASKNGWAIGIFLEGTRTSDGRIHDPKLGAAAIAAKIQAPLLPVSLWGTEKILDKDSALPKSVPITIRIGEPIAPPNSSKKAELLAITEKCTEIINSMHEMGR